MSVRHVNAAFLAHFERALPSVFPRYWRVSLGKEHAFSHMTRAYEVSQDTCHISTYVLVHKNVKGYARYHCSLGWSKEGKGPVPERLGIARSNDPVQHFDTYPEMTIDLSDLWESKSNFALEIRHGMFLYTKTVVPEQVDAAVLPLVEELIGKLREYAVPFFEKLCARAKAQPRL